jgi:hypothetical protein
VPPDLKRPPLAIELEADADNGDVDYKALLPSGNRIGFDPVTAGSPCALTGRPKGVSADQPLGGWYAAVRFRASHIRSDGKETDRGFSPMSVRSPGSPSEFSLSEGHHDIWAELLPGQHREPIGIGFTVANCRRERIGLVKQRAEKRSTPDDD